MWECERYKHHCGVCPILGSKKESDLSKKVFNRKQKTFSQIDNMTIVGLSKWLTESSKSSTLLKDKKAFELGLCSNGGWFQHHFQAKAFQSSDQVAL